MNRPACDFSALASVSSHSAISSKPSSRAVWRTRGALRVLVRLAFDGGLEVVLGGADRYTGHGVTDFPEEVEVPERAARFTLSHRAEERGDVRVALDIGLLGEVEVAAVGLALAGERGLQVGLGLAALSAGISVVSLSLGCCCPRVASNLAPYVGTPLHSSHSPRKTTSALSTSKPLGRPPGHAQLGKVPPRSRTLPQERHTRW